MLNLWIANFLIRNRFNPDSFNCIIKDTNRRSLNLLVFFFFNFPGGKCGVLRKYRLNLASPSTHAHARMHTHARTHAHIRNSKKAKKHSHADNFRFRHAVLTVCVTKPYAEGDCRLTRKIMEERICTHCNVFLLNRGIFDNGFLLKHCI